MQLTKQLKILLSDAYEAEGELTDIIHQCFKEIFKEHATYAYSLFEEDVQGGREYNGCLQSLEYYKRQINDHKKRVEEHRKTREKEDSNE